MVKCHTASQFPQLVSMKRGRILLFHHLTVFLLHAFMPGWQHCCEDAWPWSYVAVLQSIRGAEDRVQLVSMFLLISHLLHRVDWSIGACGQLAHWHLCSRKVNHIATGSSDRIKKKSQWSELKAWQILWSWQLILFITINPMTFYEASWN